MTYFLWTVFFLGGGVSHERQSLVAYLENLLCTVDVRSFSQVYKFDRLNGI